MGEDGLCGRNQSRRPEICPSQASLGNVPYQPVRALLSWSTLARRSLARDSAARMHSGSRVLFEGRLDSLDQTHKRRY